MNLRTQKPLHMVGMRLIFPGGMSDCEPVNGPGFTNQNLGHPAAPDRLMIAGP